MCTEDAFTKSGYEEQHRNILQWIWEMKKNLEQIRDTMWIWCWKDKGVPS